MKQNTQQSFQVPEAFIKEFGHPVDLTKSHSGLFLGIPYNKEGDPGDLPSLILWGYMDVIKEALVSCVLEDEKIKHLLIYVLNESEMRKEFFRRSDEVLEALKDIERNFASNMSKE
jgi:hypothetical protein